MINPLPLFNEAYHIEIQQMCLCRVFAGGEMIIRTNNIKPFIRVWRTRFTRILWYWVSNKPQACACGLFI
jgi:hypothetical protein